MIMIQNGQFIVPKFERKIGFTGDNAHKTVRFFISDSTQGEWFYRIYLKFDDGTVNYFIPDSTKTDDGTEIIWEVKDEHIFKGGIVTLQIKAFNDTGEVYHTDATHLIVGDTIEFGDCFSVKQNSEFLEYEKRLNEILKQIVTEQSKLPYIGSNKNWFVYDRETDKFVDTKVRAEGVYELLDFSVTTDKIANNCVTAAKLAKDAVVHGTIASNAIVAGNISRGAVTTDKLADGAVTMPKIAEEVFDEFNDRYTSIEVIDCISRVEYLNSCTDGGKIYLINSITPPFSTELNVSTGSTYGYLHWVGEMQKLTVIDGVSNSVKTFTRRCQRGEGSQASIIVGWSNFAEQINSYGAVNLGVVDDLSTLNGCTDTQKTYCFKVGNSLAGQISSWNISGGYAILNYYKPDNEMYGRQVLRIIRSVEFTFSRDYNPEDNYWYGFSMINTSQCYLLENKVDTLDRFFSADIAQNTADITQLKTDTLDNTEAITQNTADIDELKVKTLPSVNLPLPNGISTIPDIAFCANQSLVNVTIPNSVKSIGTSAFQSCTSLTSITIPDSVTVLKQSAFQNCTSLASITIPNSVTIIDNNAFRSCISLASVTIPNSVTKIGTNAFQACTSLTDVTIPNSVSSIGNNAFGSCPNLTNVTLGDGFNANNLNLSASTKYTADTIVSWLNALADRTGQEQYTLTIGATNKAKLTDEQLAIATNKNWNIA